MAQPSPDGIMRLQKPLRAGIALTWWHCLLQDVSNRISSFLTESGNNAKKGASSASNTNGQASSFQQQAALPTISVPTTFTHEAYSGDGSSGNAAGSNLAGRKLKQVPIQAMASHNHPLLFHHALGPLLSTLRVTFRHSRHSWLERCVQQYSEQHM